MFMSWQTFQQHAQALGVPLSSTQLDVYHRYTHLLLAANRHVNLTALRDELSLIAKFHLDALNLLPIIARHADTTVEALLQQEWQAADVGTGGGAPALPLTIAWPHLRYTLIESITKKARFLAETIADLELNAEVINARAEDVAKDPQHRQRYDLVTARAVAALPTLVELTLPLARTGGLIVLPKGPKAQEEVEAAARAITLLGGELTGVERVVVPGVEETRMAVIIRKIAPTPAAYPRRAGVPERKPLR